LSHRRPKARYTVGMLGQRIVAPLKRLLPRWWRGLRRPFRATNILPQRRRCAGTRRKLPP
jgi:hypothetical protein